MFYAKKLAGSGLADRAPFVYARGKLALWVPPGSSLAIEEKGIAALRDSSVRHIAIGNPTLTPYGRLALVVLEAARLDDPKRLVLGESVGQAAQQAQSGSVQAALLPLSLVLQMPGRHIEMPGTLEQGGVILTAAHEKALARSFVDFLLSGEAKKIFARHGYAP